MRGSLGVIVVFFGTGEGLGLDEVWVAPEPPFGPVPEAPPPVPVPAPLLGPPEVTNVADVGKSVAVPVAPVEVATPESVPLAPVEVATPESVPLAPVEVATPEVTLGSELLPGIKPEVNVKLSSVVVFVGSPDVPVVSDSELETEREAIVVYLLTYQEGEEMFPCH